MARPIASPLACAAVAALTLAVVLCLVVPMGGDDAGMGFALGCCFVLALALSVFLLRRPREALPLGDVFGLSAPLERGPICTARAPDIVALGSLLI